MRNRVVVVGSLNTDVVVRLRRLPLPGETVLGDRFDRYAGGKGLDQAVAAARSGARVSMVGALGADSEAADLRAVLATEGIDDHVVAIDDTASGVALIEVSDDGENRIVVVPGANARVTPEQVAQLLPQDLQDAVVLCQAEIPIDAVAAAMRLARARGALTMLNPAPARDLPDGLLGDVAAVVLNVGEAQALTGLRVHDAASALDAAAEVVRRGPGIAVVTRGAAGLVWMGTDGQHGSIPAFAVTAVDTVGAGDAFCGAFAAALARGEETTDALTWATAASALATTAAGAVPSLPHAPAVSDLLEQARAGRGLELISEHSTPDGRPSET